MPNPHLLPLLAAAVLGALALTGAWVWLARRWPKFATGRRTAALAPLILGGLIWTLFVYAALVEPESLVVRRVDIASGNWRGGPLTIAVIADTHVGGPHVDAARMGRIVRRINALHPDLVVMLGDYAAGHAPEASRSPAENQDILGGIATIAAVDSRYGVVAVLGNRDSWYGRASITTALQNAGAAALWNRNITIHRSGGEIVVAGLADAWTGVPDFAAALDGAPADADAIVLSHNPDPFVDMPPGPALMLAAHTHCGQVTIPFVGRPILPIRQKEFACGRIDRRGQTLYVNGGIGTSYLPLRFLNPPEITFLTIHSAARRPT